MLAPHPTWSLYDSSKLQTFLTCERRYFWEYLAGWRPEVTSNHLIFGQAIHHALEHLMRHGYGEDAIIAAYELFLTHYRAAGYTEDTDELYAPKTPTRALQCLAAYTQQYASDLERYEVLHTEVSGSVPIGEGRKLHFRWDTVLRDRQDGLIVSLEHKTGSSTWGWEKEWPLKFQIGTYTHGLYALYGQQAVKGVVVNGLFFKRTSGARGAQLFDFLRVPVYKTPEHMEVWLWNAHDLIDRLEYEMDRLSECKEREPLLQAFPLRTESCTKYGGCPYHDFCCTWANPLQHIDRLPPGWTVEYWDPRTVTATETVELKEVTR